MPPEKQAACKELCPRGAQSFGRRRPVGSKFSVFEVFKVEQTRIIDFEVLEVGRTQIIDFKLFKVRRTQIIDFEVFEVRRTQITDFKLFKVRRTQFIDFEVLEVRRTQIIDFECAKKTSEVVLLTLNSDIRDIPIRLKVKAD